MCVFDVNPLWNLHSFQSKFQHFQFHSILLYFCFVLFVLFSTFCSSKFHLCESNDPCSQSAICSFFVIISITLLWKFPRDVRAHSVKKNREEEKPSERSINNEMQPRDVVSSIRSERRENDETQKDHPNIFVFHLMIIFFSFFPCLLLYLILFFCLSLWVFISVLFFPCALFPFFFWCVFVVFSHSVQKFQYGIYDSLLSGNIHSVEKRAIERYFPVLFYSFYIDALFLSCLCSLAFRSTWQRYGRDVNKIRNNNNNNDDDEHSSNRKGETEQVIRDVNAKVG